MTKFIVLKFGLFVFDNNKENFKKWLNTNVVSIGNNKPIDLINSKNQNELKKVYECLLIIEHGIFV